MLRDMKMLVLSSLVVVSSLQAGPLTPELAQAKLDRDHNSAMRFLQEARQLAMSAGLAVESAFQRVANNVRHWIDQARGHASQAHAAALRHDQPLVERHHHLILKSINNAEVSVRKLHRHAAERKRRTIANKLHQAKESFKAAHRDARELTVEHNS